jgi:acetoin:2,6-dichlorophenolindophenol oxidoreductase subunit alpha
MRDTPRMAPALDAEIDLGGIPPARALDLYGRLRLVRSFEQRVNAMFLRGKIPGTIHLSTGQEACAVGGCDALEPTDWAILTHRGHGQALMKGISARALMAELFARETGCCKGMGGSLHVGDISVGALPGIGIVGAGIPIAAGLAFASRRDGSGRIVACFTGDGAMTEGDSHEGFNLAGLWRLPVVFICENNLYSISTRIERQMVETSIADRMAAYGITGVRVDGNNVLAVSAAVAEAVKRARAGEGPTLVECLTYRQGGHKRDDPATYRPREEVDLWLSRDPVVRYRRAIEKAGLGDAADALDRDVEATLDDAVEFAEASPLAVGLGR